MKKSFLLLVSLIIVVTSFAQNNLVATLSHDVNISMYYGVYALRDAMENAQSGDVISLSGGSFISTNMTKAVTLRGTGIDDANPTHIVGDFMINVPVEDTVRFTMEGIRCNNGMYLKGGMKNPYFFRCKFNGIDTSDSVSHVRFVNCKIVDGMSLNGTATVEFINSYMYRLMNHSEKASAFFLNCVTGSDNNFSYYSNCQLLNCIVFKCVGWSLGSFPSTTIVINCVGINGNSIFSDSQLNTNCKYASYDIFKDWTGGYTDNWSFELTESAKTEFLGDDDTEVGMFGGPVPYTSKPTYPQIKKMNVARRTTADGKLSVEIEVTTEN